VSKRVRRSLIALGAFCALYAALTGGLFAAMLQPPDEFGQIMARVPKPLFVLLAVLPFERLWNVARGGDLEVGDPAPDFDLETVEDPTVAHAEPAPRVRLSSFRAQKPVVLVFGSYT
jgi:hypothetical protein